MICSKCQEVIPEGDEMNYMGRTLCEDCYIDAVSLPKTCDVAAVQGAKVARRMAGHQGTDGLTDLQKAIYEYVKAEGKVTQKDLMVEFKMTDEQEWRRVFAPMRHCELLKGTLIDGSVYIVVMDGGPGSIGL